MIFTYYMGIAIIMLVAMMGQGVTDFIMKKALLVNDSRFESLILKDLLSKLDYEVELADEFDAVYLVEQFEPELVVVNYIMRETRGDKLIQLIKAGRPEIVCLLSSSSNVHKADFQENQLDGIIRTPVSMFTLKDLLRRVDSSKAEAAAKALEQKDGRFCDHCNADISAFNEAIVFCPFCGEEL